MFDNENDFLFKDGRDTALFLKAQELFDLVNKIGEVIPNNKMLSSVKDFMIEDASIILVKVSSSYYAPLYDHRMEAATLIRKAAMSLQIQHHSLKAYGFKHIEYYTLVHKILEEFRTLFIAWVKTFSETEKLNDPWGLFN